eukprot:TRINITY_DN10219_c0_g1_i1.p1 TRINITY_DN10219_c0_g1~~TRINITY_DN10219_c0_g1_i1.p1  ORF type:complete len:351 (+),score=117.13 TRINITY_DN10219_c0_g1_i1:104-1156(+)
MSWRSDQMFRERCRKEEAALKIQAANAQVYDMQKQECLRKTQQLKEEEAKTQQSFLTPSPPKNANDEAKKVLSQSAPLYRSLKLGQVWGPVEPHMPRLALGRALFNPLQQVWLDRWDNSSQSTLTNRSFTAEQLSFRKSVRRNNESICETVTNSPRKQLEGEEGEKERRARGRERERERSGRDRSPVRHCIGCERVGFSASPSTHINNNTLSSSPLSSPFSSSSACCCSSSSSFSSSTHTNTTTSPSRSRPLRPRRLQPIEKSTINNSNNNNSTNNNNITNGDMNVFTLSPSSTFSLSSSSSPYSSLSSPYSAHSSTRRYRRHRSPSPNRRKYCDITGWKEELLRSHVII